MFSKLKRLAKKQDPKAGEPTLGRGSSAHGLQKK
jgi:hypothetical protein